TPLNYLPTPRTAKPAAPPARTDRGVSANGGSAIWLTDARLLDQLVRGMESLGVTRFALLAPGPENPAVWSTVGR
ncbi:MAG TPA: hypothetical protein VH638_04210, partial [Gemmatimonadaceae bacterium]